MKPAKFRDVARVLKALGYTLVRTRGSHYIYGKGGGNRTIPVPRHSSGLVAAGVLRSILDALGIDEQEFNRLR